MRPEYQNLQTPNTGVQRDRTASFSFDNAENGYMTFLSDDKRNRSGKLDYKEFVAKAPGTISLDTISGTSNRTNGGIQWVNTDTSKSDRVREIYAVNDIVYRYSVETDERVILRDIGTADSATISYLSGVQLGKFGYFVIGDSSLSTTLYKYEGDQTGSITAVGDNGSGKAQYTSNAHGLTDGNTVTITGCTDTAYNVTAVISNVTTNTFDIETVTYTATDTGTWSADTLEKLTGVTALNAGRLIGKMDDRLEITGIGDNANEGQYSTRKPSGNFDFSGTDNFTSGTDVDDGGVLSGSLQDCVAKYWFKGVDWWFEKSRIVPHIVSNYDVSGTGRVKDSKTLQEEYVIDGVGVESPFSITAYNESMFFASPDGLFEHRLGWSQPKELTKPFRRFWKKFTFDEAGIVVDRSKNKIIVSCKSNSDIPNDTHLIWDLDSAYMSLVNGRYTREMFYDDINKKVIGFSSNSPEIFELYADTYQDDDGNDIELIAETRMYDMGDMYLEKKFVEFSQRVGFASETQTPTWEIFIDDDESPIATFTRSMADAEISSTTSVGSSAFDEATGGGNPDSTLEESDLNFVWVNWKGFVPHFTKMSIRVTDNSPNNLVVHQPNVLWRPTTDMKNSFNSRF